MILNKIKIHNFKSIYGVFEIDFEKVKGFWKINGQVGAGKTTIGEAIIFGLFGDVKGKNNKDLISWGEKNGFIEIDCVSKNCNLNIIREIKGDLSVKVDGEPIIFTNKRDAQKQLEDYLDVSKLTFELLCVISFNNFMSLSNMSPHDTRIFLDQVFGFSELTVYINKTKEILKDASAELLKQEYEYKNILSQIDKIKEISNITIVEGDILELKTAYEKLIKEKNDIKSKQKHALEKITSDIRNKRNELASIKILGENKAKEIAFIKKGTCPTCGAKIDDSQLEIKQAEKDILLRNYKTTKTEIDNLVEKKEKVEKEYECLFKTINDNINKAIEHKAKLEMQQKHTNASEQEIKKLIKTKEELEKDIENKKIDISDWTQLLDILSVSIKQQILNCFIPMLNASILEYTRKFNLPYEIIFDEQFKCTIKLFSTDKIINIASLSTGQLKTIDMCCILGIVKVIFSGANCNILFLDELFSNMDNELIEIACNILKNELKDTQTIFIISHQDISNHNFDGYINSSLYFDNGQKKTKYKINKP